jgi:glycosyltransferase involved in cell wall biosynthesis
MKRQVGWVTTWNVKCGIASYVAHLLHAVPPDEFIVFAARQEPTLGPDQPNCIRSWTPGKEENGLDEIARELASRSLGALVIQHNYGFFNHFELNDFIESVAQKGICIFIELHSTVDPFELENWRLTEFVRALRKCHRILAHGPADMNRLKALGLVDNVMLFPLGVVNRRRSATVPARRNDPPLIASFGFSFPNKGLLELVHAVALLNAQGKRVRLRMLNAEFPISESTEVVRAVRAAIEQLGLRDDVEFRSDYLEDEDCLRLLGEADLVVNPYQRTGESASAAVRYGIAAGRPVAVTPLPIFDDLGSAVFRMPGTAAAEIAQGIADALRHIETGSETAKGVHDAASRWLEAHDCARQGVRLMRTIRALTKRNPSVWNMQEKVNE